jgi:hypothetical protein
MCHDPELYTDHMSFNPARFLHLSPEESKAKDPRNFAFGFGRRICVGQVFGDNAVYITIASILACFDIRKKIVNGQEIIPEVEYPHFVGHPKEFDCEVVLRSKAAGNLIASTADSIVHSE